MKITIAEPKRSWSYCVIAANLVLTPLAISWFKEYAPEDPGVLLVCLGNGMLLGAAMRLVLCADVRVSLREAIAKFERESAERFNERRAILRTEMRKLWDEGEEWKR